MTHIDLIRIKPRQTVPTPPHKVLLTKIVYLSHLFSIQTLKMTEKCSRWDLWCKAKKAVKKLGSKTLDAAKEAALTEVRRKAKKKLNRWIPKKR